MPDKLAMTARQVLELATIKSAQCLGLDGRIGSLSPGKEADVVCCAKPISICGQLRIRYQLSCCTLALANVDTVIIDGNIVKQNGKLTYRDLVPTARRT